MRTDSRLPGGGRSGWEGRRGLEGTRGALWVRTAWVLAVMRKKVALGEQGREHRSPCTHSYSSALLLEERAVGQWSVRAALTSSPLPTEASG